MFWGTTNIYFAAWKHFCALYKCFRAQNIFPRTIIYVYLILPQSDGHTREFILALFNTQTNAERSLNYF